MILDADAAAATAPLSAADVVVVGAGAVGILVAKALADRGHSVLVLETGGAVAATAAEGFGATSVGKSHNGTRVGRAFGLGGTSTLWGGQLSEFVASDLTRPGHEWPIEYIELRRWYERTYAELGLPERRPDADYRRAFGIDPSVAAAVEPFFTAWMPQPNLATLFRRRFEQDGRLNVLLNATAYGLDFHGSRATQVALATPAGIRVCIPTRQVILAAGVVGNAQLFLTSSKAATGAPWRGNRVVGAYFQDHLVATVAEAEPLSVVKFRRFFENGNALGMKLQPKLRQVPSGGAETGVSGFFGFRSSMAEPLADFKRLLRGLRSGLSFSDLRTLPVNAWRVGGSFAPLVAHYLVHRRVMAFFDRGVDLLVQAEQWPLAESRIDIAAGSSCGPFGLLPVVVDWRLDGREAGAIRRFVAETGAYLEAEGLARLRPDPRLEGSDSELLALLTDNFHQCGGLRMSALPDAGVVDPDCRVWGTDNVYVAGASVFPTSSYANPTLTAMALGLRLADHLSRASGR
jgi:choline dehydrogenase-like flavoprotein